MGIMRLIYVWKNTAQEDVGITRALDARRVALLSPPERTAQTTGLTPDQETLSGCEKKRTIRITGPMLARWEIVLS